jgi:hypothetical protein
MNVPLLVEKYWALHNFVKQGSQTIPFVANASDDRFDCRLIIGANPAACAVGEEFLREAASDLVLVFEQQPLELSEVCILLTPG